MSGDLRDRATASREFERNLVVEAGAGTGKTSLLVERILNAVGTGRVGIEQVAAITFTKKAAGEMKHRIAAGLERLLHLAGEAGGVEFDQGKEADRAYAWLTGEAGAGSGEIGRRALAALNRLDRATVETIHTFCASILRAFPMEAGVDPRFEVDEGERFRLLAVERWESFLREELGADAPRIGLWRSVLAILPLETVAEAAAGLAGFDVPAEMLQGRLPDVDAGLLFREPARSLLERVERILERNPRLHHQTRPKFEAMREGLALLAESGIDALIEYYEGHAKLAAWIEKKAWPKRTKSLAGVDGDEYEETARAALSLFGELAAADDGLIADLVELLSPFALDVRERYLARAFVGYDGLLALARDLLRDHPGIRDAVKARYRMLLVDEFQDTDPLQYEIVLFLGEVEGGAARDAFAADLQDGRLFIVGDAKQSIYRFRGADYEAFTRAVDRIAPERKNRLNLTTNFRSDPEVLEPINALFAEGGGGDWSESRYQPEYVPIHAHREGVEEPRVELWTVGGGRPLTADLRRSLEGEAIAAWIGSREIEFRRITILLRAFSKLPLYLQPLRQQGIPYVVDGGKGFMERPETSHLISVLRALLRPADQAALLAFLRSPAGGVSDLDLARFRAAGGRWDWRSEIADRDEHVAVAGAFELLKRLHEEIAGAHPEQVVRRVLARTGLPDLSACAFEGPQRIANLRKLALRASEMTRDGRMSLLEVLEVLEDDTTSEVESESPLADETTDAVRVLTVHKAKGLENDVVIVPDLAGGRRAGERDPFEASLLYGPPESLAVRAGGVPNLARVRLEMEEREHGRAEDLRLLYVAMTRAREKLVLVTGNQKGRAPWMEALRPWGYSADALPGGGEILDVPGGVVHRLVDEVESAKVGEETRATGAPEAVEAFRQAVKTAGKASVPTFRRPSGREEDPDAVRAAAAPDRDTARIAGTMVHRVLELWDLGEDRSLLDLAARIASDEPRATSKDVAEIVREFLGSSLADELRNADVVGREVPILMSSGDGSVYRGSIDLLYRDAEGRYIVADFKTDASADHAALAEKYRDQLSIYAEAVRAALDLPALPAMELWHLRSGKRIGVKS